MGNLYPSVHQAAPSITPPEFNAPAIFMAPISTPADHSSDQAVRDTQQSSISSLPNTSDDRAFDADHQSDSPTLSLSEESDFEHLEDAAAQKGRQTDPQVCELRNRFWMAKRRIKEQQQRTPVKPRRDARSPTDENS